ncbi:MAG: iron-containing alcohol dehydrogenase [Treponema sp.]|jgi:alcohol dehydrogenase|nr:iron-containing alcohol dehydrogenase [Treponema sp.]
MTDIVYKLDPEIIIGYDSVSRAGILCASLGGKALIITEQLLYEANAIGRLQAVLEQSGVESILFDEISSQSNAEETERAADLARGARCNVVIGFGGLKTQSIARMAARTALSRFGLFEFLDSGKDNDPFIPYIAIPAFEPDLFSVANYFIAMDPRDRSVKQIKTPGGFCKAVIMDGGFFSGSLSGKHASTTVFDGFCTAVEAYCSAKAGFFSDSLLEQAIALYGKMIKTQPENFGPGFMESYVNAAFLTAMGSSISVPGIGTALAYSLSAKFPVAKSWCSTVILPYIMEKLAAARPDKMAKVAALMDEPVEGISVAEAAAMVPESIRHYMGLLQVPARLKEFNLSLDRLIPAAETARELEFVAYSPWTVASENAFDILKQAF